MKAIMVMFDSLNRHMLPTYGCDWVHAPNFERLSKKTVVFNNSYAGSMACMPARRELHTGRYNFLHRSWGPIEPFDDSMPEILKNNCIHTHLVSDHYHYWEEGGCNYHTRYNTWQISRGQEGDPWIGDSNIPDIPHPNYSQSRGKIYQDWTNCKHIRENKGKPKPGYYRPDGGIHQDWINRANMKEEKDMPQPKTFAMGLDFMERNKKHDNWFLQIETFDPHEPYCVPQRFKDLYDYDFDKYNDDWPPYSKENDKELSVHYKYLNAALISMCDYYLGIILDKMDEHDMWKDTMLIVNTDHGFMLGEHDWWAKNIMPFYNEIVHMPLFIWDPRTGINREQRDSLVQTIDLPATILDFFGQEIPKDMQGIPLKDTIIHDTPIREAALFGIHGRHVNVTDGKYVYMRGTNRKNEPLFNYTHMPTNMRHTFPVEDMQRLTELAEPFTFTKGCKSMKIPNSNSSGHGEKVEFQTLLFDLQTDPNQEHPISDPEIEQMMINHLIREMKKNDAPVEQYERLGLNMDGSVGA